MSTITGPEGVHLAGLLQAMHALTLEVNTGLRHSRVNWLVVIQNAGYTGPTRGTVKNKVAGIEWLVQEVEDIWPNHEVSPSVQRALKAVQS